MFVKTTSQKNILENTATFISRSIPFKSIRVFTIKILAKHALKCITNHTHYAPRKIIMHHFSVVMQEKGGVMLVMYSIPPITFLRIMLSLL